MHAARAEARYEDGARRLPTDRARGHRHPDELPLPAGRVGRQPPGTVLVPGLRASRMHVPAHDAETKDSAFTRPGDAWAGGSIT